MNDPIYGGRRTVYAAAAVLLAIAGCVVFVLTVLWKG